jgi:hypothetical protein
LDLSSFVESPARFTGNRQPNPRIVFEGKICPDTPGDPFQNPQTKIEVNGKEPDPVTRIR